MANFKPLPLPTSPNAPDWSFFKAHFADYIILADMANASQDKLKVLLLVSLGRERCEILEGLPDPKDMFDECNTQLDEYFCRKSSTLLKQKTFLSAQQEQSETANAFAYRLRRLVLDCAFGDNKMTLLHNIFVISVFNDRLGEKLLAEEETELTFDLVVKKAEAFEHARQERALSKSTLISAVRQLPDQRPGNMTPAASKPASTSSRRQACYHCGSSNHIASAAICPAVSDKCRVCGKNGHFAKVCRSMTKATISHIEETLQSDNSDDSRDFTVFATASTSAIRRKVLINDVCVNILIDTGAEVSILPLSLGVPVGLKPCAAAVQAWGKFNIPVCGLATCTVNYKGRTIATDFIVVNFPASKGTMLPLFNLSIRHS